VSLPSDGVAIRRHLLRALPLEAADIAFVTGWRARGLRQRVSVRQRHPITRPDSPVLVIPGVYEGSHFLDPLAVLLRPSGRPIHTLPELGRNRAPILETVRVARSYLERNGLSDVTIVSHSKGGIVGKLLMVDPDTGPRIRDLFAIAAPFAGSRYARFTPTRELRDFSTRETIFSELAERAEVNDRIVSVFGAIDPQIPDPGVLPGARNVQLATSGHFRVLADRAMQRLLREHVSRPLSGS
jgi:hypothetical protein